MNQPTGKGVMINNENFDEFNKALTQHSALREELDGLLRQLYLAIEVKLRREIEPWNSVYGSQVESIKSATDIVNDRYEKILLWLSQRDSLEQLMEECGMHTDKLPVFKQLNWHSTHKRKTPIPEIFEIGAWSAKARIGKGKLGHITTWGSTPKEAVERLIEALKKQNGNSI